MKKKKRLSTWLIILLIAVVGGFLIWTENPFVHQFTTEKKLTASLTVAGDLYFNSALRRFISQVVELVDLNKFFAAAEGIVR